MKISYNWLKEYVGINETPEELAVILTSTGLEVDGIEHVESVKGGLHGVVVGEVLTCEKHPDADRLKVTTVDVGGDEPLQIVCGAPNVDKGQKVAVATVGTTLYFSTGEEVKMKRSKIRGIESLGMICAEDELGLGGSHDGIMVLAAKYATGTPLREVLNITDDYVIEIGLTPNRADATSHIGVARDIAAYKRGEVNYPNTSAFKVDNTNNTFNVEVLKPEACIRYSGLTITGVKVSESPEWLKNCLRAIGLNPRNNIVDITNFVLHEYGQPLHAFDANKVTGNKIVVNTCNEGTPFTCLDGTEIKLQSSDLMICNTNEPMCIAGVMGGVNSGVTESTTSIFLESACFNPVSVRKTARKHGIFSDSSFRFERGVDPNIAIEALKRAALLIKELAGGEISSEITDWYPEVVKAYPVDMNYSRISSVIGKTISKEEINSILSALKINIVSVDGDDFKVEVPTYRIDVQRECDVLEDILRIYGYNNVEIPLQVKSTLSYAPSPDKDGLVNMVANFLSANGFNEMMANSLTKKSYYAGLETYKEEDTVSILNPLSTDLNGMRQTLLFSGLEAVSRNINHKSPNLKLYENGNCYKYNASKDDGTLKAYSEDMRLSIFVTGNNVDASWDRKELKTDFHTLKEIVEKVFMRFNINFYDLEVEDAPKDIFLDGYTLLLNKNKLVTMGIVSKKICKSMDIQQDVYYAEIFWDTIFKYVVKHTVNFKEIVRFPGVRRDLALVLDRNVQYSELRKIAFKAERKLLKQVSLFDIYEGDKLPEGKKQYALSFILEDSEKTLTDKQIEKTMDNLLKNFQKEAGAELR